MLKRILVTLDGSNLAEFGLAYVKELAPAFDSEIDLLSVFEGRSPEYRGLLEAYLGRIADSLAREVGLAKTKIRATVLDGHPAEMILDFARRQKPDLIITVSHGHSGILPWTMGSTADKIVHHAPLSVLLVRAAAMKKKGTLGNVFGKILLPLDGSPASEQALPWAEAIAARLHSQITLLSVVESGQKVHTIGGRDYIPFTEQYVEAMREELSSYLERTVKRLKEKNITVRGLLRAGNAAHEILKLAKESAARLVVMATHGRHGPRGWVFCTAARPPFFWLSD
jgi:nucleotide-binding universal stress UspA family protein